jgi:translation initiation factor IF-3
MFRGREMQHPELGKRILDQVADRVHEVARVEVIPKLDGRNMIMVLAPDKKKSPGTARPRSAPAPDDNGAAPVATAPPSDGSN